MSQNNGNGKPVVEQRTHFYPGESVPVSDGITVFPVGAGDKPSEVHIIFKSSGNGSTFHFPFQNEEDLTQFIENLTSCRDDVFSNVPESDNTVLEGEK